MEKTIRVVFLAGILAISSLTLAPAHVSADPNKSCMAGTPVTSGVTLSVDGEQQTAGTPPAYGIYTLIVCRDVNNSSYSTTIGRDNGPSSGSALDLTSDDLGHVFTITFTPQTGDIPLLAEGHGDMTSFSYDAASKLVTVDVKPMPYSDIYGDDCTTASPSDQSPLACARAVTKASHDSVTAWFNVRFQDPTGKGSEYGYLPNMIWSSNAYAFWDRTFCPDQSGSDGSGIQFEIGGPHYKADGLTPNTALAKVFMPTATVVKCWGAPPAVVKDNLKITRTEGGQTQTATTGFTTDTGLYYTVTASDSGLLISIPAVTFSVPKYKMGTSNKKSLSKKTITFARAITLAKMTKPKGGSILVSTKGSTKCVAAYGKIYAYKKGTCSFTVTSYNKNHVKVKSTTASFVVS